MKIPTEIPIKMSEDVKEAFNSGVIDGILLHAVVNDFNIKRPARIWVTKNGSRFVEAVPCNMKSKKVYELPGMDCYVVDTAHKCCMRCCPCRVSPPEFIDLI